jgi:hypothetical protein
MSNPIGTDEMLDRIEELEDKLREPKMLDTVWLMHTKDGFYLLQPSERCKPEDHGNINDHLMMISSFEGDILWKRLIQ